MLLFLFRLWLNRNPTLQDFRFPQCPWTYQTTQGSGVLSSNPTERHATRLATQFHDRWHSPHGSAQHWSPYSFQRSGIPDSSFILRMLLTRRRWWAAWRFLPQVPGGSTMCLWPMTVKWPKGRNRWAEERWVSHRRGNAPWATRGKGRVASLSCLPRHRARWSHHSWNPTAYHPSVKDGSL